MSRTSQLLQKIGSQISLLSGTLPGDGTSLSLFLLLSLQVPLSPLPVIPAVVLFLLREQIAFQILRFYRNRDLNPQIQFGMEVGQIPLLDSTKMGLLFLRIYKSIEEQGECQSQFLRITIVIEWIRDEDSSPSQLSHGTRTHHACFVLALNQTCPFWTCLLNLKIYGLLRGAVAVKSKD